MMRALLVKLDTLRGERRRRYDDSGARHCVACGVMFDSADRCACSSDARHCVACGVMFDSADRCACSSDPS